MWLPTLPDRDAPAYARLTDALAADVAEGRLKAGERLPPQRDLAYRLGLSVGTVTRAYSEAERRGLISGQVGRGSFVAEQAAAEPGGVIDLARNLPPAGIADRVFAGALAKAAKRPDIADALAYPPHGGAEIHRRMGAQWLSRTANYEASPARLITCAGAQQGMAIAFGALCRPGDAIIAEAASFSGIKTLADHAGYRLVPAPLDAEGMTPEGLDAAAAASGARAVYVLPLQNPTGRLMGPDRRRELIEVARRRDLFLVEDDIYGAYAADRGFKPLAALAPERVAYVSSVTKTLGPGLRLGYLSLPTPALHERAMDVLRAVAFSSPSLGALVTSEMIESGLAYEILEAARAEFLARGQIARRVLAGILETGGPAMSPHLWAPMSELEAERAWGRAQRAGVALTPPRAPFLDGVPVDGLRICLGGARDHAELETGLLRLKDALSAGPDGRNVV